MGNPDMYRSGKHLAAVHVCVLGEGCLCGVMGGLLLVGTTHQARVLMEVVAR